MNFFVHFWALMSTLANAIQLQLKWNLKCAYKCNIKCTFLCALRRLLSASLGAALMYPHAHPQLHCQVDHQLHCEVVIVNLFKNFLFSFESQISLQVECESFSTLLCIEDYISKCNSSGTWSAPLSATSVAPFWASSY